MDFGLCKILDLNDQQLLLSTSIADQPENSNIVTRNVVTPKCYAAPLSSVCSSKCPHRPYPARFHMHTESLGPAAPPPGPVPTARERPAAPTASS
jgi:hypothetical protein